MEESPLQLIRIQNSKSVFNSDQKLFELPMENLLAKAHKSSSKSLNLRGYSPLKQQLKDPSLTQRTILNNEIVSKVL